MQENKTNSIFQILRDILCSEGKEILRIANNNNILENIYKVVNFIGKGNYEVAVFGVGKSGHIGKKFAATLSSVGTRALFIHPTEALHGDLGMLPKKSVAVLISKSGETEELKKLLPYLKKKKVPIISIVNNSYSTLAENSDFSIVLEIQKEAGPHNLAPTTSTTVTLAVTDGIAMGLMYLKNFSSEDFGELHPAGSLGKRLFLQVRDIYHKEIPVVRPDSYLYKVIESITKGRLGCTLVMQEDNLQGIITDGDLRRWIKKNLEDLIAIKHWSENPEKTPQNLNFPIFARAKDLMSPTPKTVFYKALAYEALQIMERFKITQLVAIDENKKVKGIIHLHDILKEGIK